MDHLGMFVDSHHSLSFKKRLDNESSPTPNIEKSETLKTTIIPPYMHCC
jgi:hypothetical protein